MRALARIMNHGLMDRPRHLIDCAGFTLRRWQPEEDFELLFQLIEESLDHLRPWMPWAADHSRQATAAFLAGCEPAWRSGQEYNWAISVDGRPRGSCSLFRTDDDRGREMGYWLHPNATGCGLATRAATAMTGEAFALPHVEYVQIVHDLANAASGAVPRRLGFALVGHRPARPPLAPAESGTDAVWHLRRPPPT